MKKQILDRPWKFHYVPWEDWMHRGSHPDAQDISLPHDFRIALTRCANTIAGGSEGYFPGGVGYYETELYVDESLLNQRVRLYFDGVYRLAEVRLNGSLLCIHRNGYTPFWVELTGKLRLGKNHLHITVRADMLPGARWYPGAGIYRDVMLFTGAKDGCINPENMHLTMKRVSKELSRIQWAVSVQARPGDALRCRIYAPNGTLVKEHDMALSGNGRYSLEMCLEHCRLWSAESPELYVLETILERDGVVLDTETIRFGLREMRWSEEGFFINGQKTLFRGGCVHHDHGILGVCAYRDAEERKVRLLKDAGFNAVRCSHNPPSAHFLDLCDELGLYVINELFDNWREGKKSQDDHIFFESDWYENLHAVLLRDRNHPCVVMWSTGNEVHERSGASQGALWSKRLADEIRELDTSRPITNALCHFEMDEVTNNVSFSDACSSEPEKDWFLRESEEFVEPLDVVGYNYLEYRYEKDHQFYPRRIFCGTESFPMKALESWRKVEKLPYVIGDFCWTAMDYLGEAGIGCSEYDGPARGLQPYPALTANCGDLDLLGFKRPQSYFRNLIWGRSHEPYLWVQPPQQYGREENISDWGWPDGIADWDFPGQEGQVTLVRVYASGNRVELYLNGVLQAEGIPKDFVVSFSIRYQPGELCAVSYDGSQQIGRCSLKTPGGPASIRLISDKPILRASLQSLGYALAEIVDSAGNLVRRTPLQLSFSIEGPGEILACGSADPFYTGNYSHSQGTCWQGRIMVICRGDTRPGRTTLYAECLGLPKAEVTWLCE